MHVTLLAVLFIDQFISSPPNLNTNSHEYSQNCFLTLYLYECKFVQIVIAMICFDNSQRNVFFLIILYKKYLSYSWDSLLLYKLQKLSVLSYIKTLLGFRQGLHLVQRSIWSKSLPIFLFLQLVIGPCTISASS